MVSHMAYIDGTKHHPRWDFAQRKGGWIGVKVVCDSVSKVRVPSDGDEEGKGREVKKAEGGRLS